MVVLWLERRIVALGLCSGYQLFSWDEVFVSNCVPYRKQVHCQNHRSMFVPPVSDGAFENPCGHRPGGVGQSASSEFQNAWGELMAKTGLRDTEYATEIATASLSFDDAQEACEEARIERLDVKGRGGNRGGQEEIRFSWWREGRMLPRPLDLTEDDLLKLLKSAIERDVFTAKFTIRLRQLL